MQDSGDGATVLIEGPAGIGKTALLGALGERAAAEGFTVLRARGSEMEQEFGYGVVRQLFVPFLRSLGGEERSRLLSGPAALAAAIFGMAEAGAIEVAAAESSLYGLFWLLAGLIERGPVVLAIDDAHWSDAASLRFVRYLGQRLDGVPTLTVLAARPNEPGVQTEMVRGLTTELGSATIRPSLLSEEGTAALVRARFGGDDSEPVETAFHEATGGNPFLVRELIAELDPRLGIDSISPERIAEMGPERIAASVIDRARRLDAEGPEVARAIAVLGDGANLQAVAALVGTEAERVAAIIDGLAAATIVVDAPGHRFVHPLLRGAVYEEIPAANRSLSHGRAATVLAEQGAEPAEVAAHLLLSEPGSVPAALDVLDAAALKTAEQGAPDSAIVYLRRALAETTDPERRTDLLRRLGSAEVSVRDPAAIGHLQEAAELAQDPELALDIMLELIEVFGIAGLWEQAEAAIAATAARFEGKGLPGELDFEAYRASMRGYNPATADVLGADLPRLLSLVEGRLDPPSRLLRWVLAALGATRDRPAAEILALVGPPDQEWNSATKGRESSLVSNAILAMVLVDSFDDGEQIAAALLDDSRRRGSLLGTILGVGFVAAMETRRGRLDLAETSLNTAIDLVRTNELSLMAMTTILHFCLDTIVERRGLEPVAALVETLELPPPFGETSSGAMVADVRAALRLSRGERAQAIADLEKVERIFVPMQAGPRFSSWRSRLALAIADEDPDRARTLAEEEHRLAVAIESRRTEAVALRTLGVLNGGEAGIESLRESVAILRDSAAQLDLARSLAELGAALRRANQRSEAREHLREASDLAQRCGAERLEARIQEEMRVAGAKPRRRAISGIDALTASEQRVAAAAAGGASNREIAQELFVSLRTVEMHLTNAYRKLGISSRTELGAMLEERP